jgi:hypothetical protein
MSYHYPHHVATIVAATRPSSARAGQVVSRHPSTLAEHFRTKSSANWREDSVAIAAAFVVMLITAWLIWAALAEAVLVIAKTA